MKKIVIVIIALFIIVAGGLFAAAKLAPVGRIEKAAVAEVKARTGRDLSFSSADIVFWPSVGVQLKDVKFSNATWGQDKEMVTIGALDLRLAVIPLLKKEVKIERFILRQPVIHLEKAADGSTNWTFPQAGGDKATMAKTKEESPALPSGIAFAFSAFQIEDGTLTYADKQAGTQVALSKINIVMKLPDLQSALNINGTASYKGKDVTLALGLEKPMELAQGKTSAGTLDLKTDVLDADVKGTFATSGTFLTGGQVTADISSLSQLLSWIGTAPANNLPFEKITFKAATGLTDKALTLTDAALTLDDIAANGDVSVGFGGAKPSLTARLSLNKIDLDRFLSGAKGAADADDTAKASSSGWDNTPIDFSALKKANADLVLKTGGFSLKGVDVGASTLTVTLKDGALAFSSSKATLFGGTFSSNLGLDASAATPAVKFGFKMDGVQAKPVLQKFANFSKLTGTAQADINVASTGDSQKAIVGALSGGGSVMFHDGALQGIDFVKIAKAVQGGLDNLGVGAGKTDFVALGGTFKITKGVVHSDDLSMKGPLLQATAKGDTDLPRKRVNYEVVPVLTASSAVAGAKGISVPVIVSGSFSAIKARPDLKAALKNLPQNKAAIKQTLDNVKAQTKGIGGSLKSLKEDLKKDPLKSLGGMLGGGGLFNGAKTQAAPAPAAPAPEAPATGGAAQ